MPVASLLYLFDPSCSRRAGMLASLAKREQKREPTGTAMQRNITGLLARVCRASLVLAALAVIVTAAIAQPARPVIGTLTCRGDGAIGLILGSREALQCNFETVKGNRTGYAGTLIRLGIDVGAHVDTVLIWTVLGSTTDFPADALQGKYVGASAEVSAGLGVGANALVGGSQYGIVLQPLSVQAQVGLNLAVGVAELDLRYRN